MTKSKITTNEEVATESGYDIIGDIHGCAKTLVLLLETLGYKKRHGVFEHPARQVVFLGDLIDRGPFEAETVAIVKSMVEADQAFAIMGNHEYNAIAFYTPDKVNGGYLRQRSEKNRGQHRAFLNEFESDPEKWCAVIEWFKTLPLWLDLGGIRVVHACWDPEAMGLISEYDRAGQWLSEALLVDSANNKTAAFEAIETLLKGKEIDLPDGHYYHDKEGVRRHRMRVRWWDSSADSFRRAYIGPEQARTNIPDDEIEGDHLVEYGHDEPPLFLGHYWLTGPPAPLASNLACLDYSVAKPGGSLVAYRWSGETELVKERFVGVKRVES